MSTQFDYDVFLSHSSKDKSRHGGMRELASRIKQEIFTIKNPRHAEYWQAHEYPVMLVIRTSDSQIR